MQKSINKLRILTPEKFQAEYPHIFKRNFGEIALNRVHFCKAECLRQAVTGTFAIPRKTKLTGDKITFGYCIAEEQLIFIENQDHIKIEMKKVREYQDEERTSPLLLLFDWMEYLIKDDMLFLQDYEENLSHLEEELLEGNMEDFDRKILLSRKELSVLSAYYEQLSDLKSKRRGTNHAGEIKRGSLQSKHGSSKIRTCYIYMGKCKRNRQRIRTFCHQTKWG